MTATGRSVLGSDLARLRRRGPATGWIPASLDRVVETAQSLPGVDEVVLALADGDGVLGAVAASRPAWLELAARQSELNQGPSVLAVCTDEMVVSADAVADPSWPALAGLLRELGIGAVMSVPVRLRGRPVGVLELTTRDPGPFAIEAIDTAGTVADVVAELLEAVARAEEHRGQVEQLEHALTTRVLVEQAKGVMMAQTDLAEGEAFEQLRRTARASRLSVAEVARTVLANRHGPAGRDADGGAALERLTRLAVTRMPAGELLTAILEPVAALAGADVAAVLVPAGREGELEGFARPAPGPGSRRVRPLLFPATAGLAGQVLADGIPRLVPQAVRPDPAFPGVPLWSAAAVPLTFGGQPFGALLVARTGGQPLTPAELHRLQLAAARVGPAAIGARLDELQAAGRASERAALDRLRRLQAVTAALSGALTPVEVARVVAEEGVRALRADGGVIAINTPDGGIEVLAAAGYDDQVIDSHRRLPATSGLPLAVAAREGRAIWLGSAEDHERFPATRELLVNEATASVPLVTHGRCLGVLGLSFSVRQSFDEDTRLFITALADQCAQALERARLYEQAGRERLAAVAERDRLAYLAEASALLAGPLDFKATLDQIVWLAVPRLADYCFVFLVEGGVLRTAAVAARDEATMEILDRLSAAYPLSAGAEGPLDEMRRTGRTYLFPVTPDEQLAAMAVDEEHLRLMRALRVSSSLMVPLRGRAEWFGAIAFCRQVGGGPPYGELDATLAEDLARRAGLALETARRFEALNRPPGDDSAEEPTEEPTG